MAKTPAERQAAYRARKKQAVLAAVTEIRHAGNSAPELGAAGTRLWAHVTAEWDLAEHELSVLRQAARAADRLDAMAAELDGAPLVVVNHRGDQVPHPLLCESRQTAALLARLCHTLGLPSGDEDDERVRRSSRRSHRPAFYATHGA